MKSGLSTRQKIALSQLTEKQIVLKKRLKKVEVTNDVEKINKINYDLKVVEQSLDSVISLLCSF
ncbi:MAG: hypothetical protein U9Q85_03570 [Patescibacteria group bacterium]|nr:hypothetical protein [Patescibacteria group bacterium]